MTDCQSAAQFALRLAVCALLSAPLLAKAAGIPAAFHGNWVRADAACGAGASLRIEAQRLVFRHGAHSQRYDKLELVPSSAGRAEPGTLEVLADLPDGSPFLLFLTPGSPLRVNLNWRPTEDLLPKRYPLHPQALKRCPA